MKDELREVAFVISLAVAGTLTQEEVRIVEGENNHG
jgi:hypothetical protein